MGRGTDAARRLKHGGFLARKRARPLTLAAHDAVVPRLVRAWPYRYSVERYQDPRGSLPFDHFLDRSAPAGWVSDEPLPVPRVVRCLWTGDNPLTENRRRSLTALREANPDVEVLLVTPENLATQVVPGHPLHPAYPRLSAVHRSDYLRGYLMHHHGGGYCDIKPGQGSWAPYLDRVRDDPQLWLLGYPEPSSDAWANLGGPLLRDLRRYYSLLAGSSAFVARPRTAFTAEWLAEVHRRLDYYAADLERSPATDPYGTNPGYPVTWIGIQADVFGPLQLKHLLHVEVDVAMTPSFTAYR